MGKHRKQTPAWVLGLILAIVLSVATILVLSALGYGDDPVVETLAALSR